MPRPSIDRALLARFLSIFIVSLFVFSACSAPPRPTQNPADGYTSQPPTLTSSPATATASPVPPRLLTICMAQEPDSLFLYGDSSAAARSIREAIYDGPLDQLHYGVQPVILERIPDLANGDAILEPVQVQAGAIIVDARGRLTNLADGVQFLPSGCSQASCAQTYNGQEMVEIDQLVVHFRMRSGLLWADGAPLRADDSQYSYEVARALYPRARAGLLARTQSYQALDETTVEWRGVPGDRDPQYALNFFTPLPRHAWGDLVPAELFNTEVSSRKPLGWGAYVLQEWVSGDHITLLKNPNYFRAADGLPHFERLVFRFVDGEEQALAALQAGECDFIDDSAGLQAQRQQLEQLRDAGQLKLAADTDAAWEHIDFNLGPLPGTGPDGTTTPAFFQLKEVRQAVAMCIDRQGIAKQLFQGQVQVPNTYVSPDHPLANSQAQTYSFDPLAGAALLESAGWVDEDSRPDTPRVARGVAGVPDGTPFVFDYLVSQSDEQQRAAQMIQTSLRQCGLQANLRTLPAQELLAPGPDGPIFGRKFSAAQFSWQTGWEPPCFLYTSSEIPGPYPDYPKGWGGANASGFSDPGFDQACSQAMNSLPEEPQYKEAHDQAQAIFAEQLPAIPLYMGIKLVAMRPDMCGVELDPPAQNDLWNLEAFDYGETCAP